MGSYKFQIILKWKHQHQGLALDSFYNFVVVLKPNFFSRYGNRLTTRFPIPWWDI